jgi:quercetin dioxygenase-like cupin family protein
VATPLSLRPSVAGQGLTTNNIAAVGERTVRRVVTGTTDGISHVSRDDLVQPVTVSARPGYAWHRLWSLDDPPTDPPSAEVEGPLAHFPPPGGIRFNLFTVPPQQSQTSGALSTEAERELEELLPGRTAYMESGQSDMHRTPSVDLICVLSGEIWLELDAEEVHLREGDCVVQNGARHAWRNKGDRPCTMAIVLVGADAG